MKTPADIVIERFGGLTATAKAVGNGVTRQAVWGWKKRGAVPLKRQTQVLDAARRNKVTLSAAELIGSAS